MKNIASGLTVAFCVLTLGTSSSRGDCVHPDDFGYKPTQVELTRILASQQKWLTEINAVSRDTQSEFNLSKALSERKTGNRPTLCNADRAYEAADGAGAPIVHSRRSARG